MHMYCQIDELTPRLHIGSSAFISHLSHITHMASSHKSEPMSQDGFATHQEVKRCPTVLITTPLFPLEGGADEGYKDFYLDIVKRYEEGNAEGAWNATLKFHEVLGIQRQIDAVRNTVNTPQGQQPSYKYMDMDPSDNIMIFLYYFHEMLEAVCQVIVRKPVYDRTRQAWVRIPMNQRQKEAWRRAPVPDPEQFRKNWNVHHPDPSSELMTKRQVLIDELGESLIHKPFFVRLPELDHVGALQAFRDRHLKLG